MEGTSSAAIMTREPPVASAVTTKVHWETSTATAQIAHPGEQQ
jgi:hypothetical protein